MKIKIPEYITRLSTYIYLTKYPFWVFYNPKLHLIKGYEIRIILNEIKPGDILIRSYNGYLNSIFIPGFWSHTGIYVGGDKVIHALNNGMVEEDILDFLRTDNVAILRPKFDFNITDIINVAYKLLGIKYDYDFSSNNNKVYCTEAIDIIYKNIFKNEYTDTLLGDLLIPDNIYNSKLLDIIVEYRH